MIAYLKLFSRHLWLIPVLLFANYLFSLALSQFVPIGAYQGFANWVVLWWFAQNLTIAWWISRNSLWLFRQMLPKQPWLIVAAMGMTISVLSQLLLVLLQVSVMPRHIGYDFMILAGFWLLALTGYSSAFLVTLSSNKSAWLLPFGSAAIIWFFTYLPWTFWPAALLFLVASFAPIFKLSTAKGMAAGKKSGIVLVPVVWIVLAMSYTPAYTGYWPKESYVEQPTIVTKLEEFSRKTAHYRTGHFTIREHFLIGEVEYNAFVDNDINGIEPALSSGNFTPNFSRALANPDDAIRYDPIFNRIESGLAKSVSDYWTDARWEDVQAWFSTLNADDLKIYQLSYANLIIVNAGNVYHVDLSKWALDQDFQQPILTGVTKTVSTIDVMNLSEQHASHFVWLEKDDQAFFITSKAPAKIHSLGSAPQGIGSYIYIRAGGSRTYSGWTDNQGSTTEYYLEEAFQLLSADAIYHVVPDGNGYKLNTEQVDANPGGQNWQIPAFVLALSSAFAFALAFWRKASLLEKLASLCFGLPFIAFLLREKSYEY